MPPSKNLGFFRIPLSPVRAATLSKIGRDLYSRLQQLAAGHPLVGDVRGRGLVMGVELIRNHESREPIATEAAKVV